MQRHIPTDIAYTIIDLLAGTPHDPALVRSWLITCTHISHTFYWPATQAIFRALRLEMRIPQRALWDPRTWVLLPTDANTIRRASARLHALLALLRARPALAGAMLSLEIFVDQHHLIFGARSGVWGVLDALCRAGTGLQAVALRGANGYVWQWMDGVGGAERAAQVRRVLQMPTVRKIHLERIRIRGIDVVVDMFSSCLNARHISVAHVVFDAESGGDLAGVFSPSGSSSDGQQLCHITTATVQIASYDAAHVTIPCQLYDSLTTLEMSVNIDSIFLMRRQLTHSSLPQRDCPTFGMYQFLFSQNDLSLLSQLKTLRLAVYGGYTAHPCDWNTSQDLSFFGPLMRVSKPTNIEEITLRLHYAFTKENCPSFLALLARPQPVGRGLHYLISARTWAGFHPCLLRTKHPALKRLTIVVEMTVHRYVWADREAVAHRMAAEIEARIRDGCGEDGRDDLRSACRISVRLLS